MAIEKPSAPEAGSHCYQTIGQFYAAIREGFVTLHKKMGDNLFVNGGSPNRQLGKGEGYHPPPTSIREQTRITNLEEALYAIESIVIQGEGSPHSELTTPDDSEELAHYYRFKQLRDDLRDGKVDLKVYPSIKNPTAPLYLMNQELLGVNKLVSALYSYMLAQIEHMWEPRSQDAKKVDHRGLHALMVTTLEPVCRWMMKQQLFVDIQGEVTNAGPSFELFDFRRDQSAYSQLVACCEQSIADFPQEPIFKEVLEEIVEVVPNVEITHVESLGAGDLQAVRDAIVESLEAPKRYDDGSFGPLLIRLAWHASATWDQNTRTGGSNGATMRYAPEATDEGNNGLAKAREILDPIQTKFPNISLADLWIFAGTVAIEEAGGPKIPFRLGRADFNDDSQVPPNGRLPDGAQGVDHIRQVFVHRLGMTDRELVALIGAHAMGRCHKDRSGYTGRWTKSPTEFTNQFYEQLLTKNWVKKEWDGPEQFVDEETGTLMMLPADMALLDDDIFRGYAEEFAQDEPAFFAEFSKAWVKLTENGCQNLHAP
jgi:cytochrome c peroxidase